MHKTPTSFTIAFRERVEVPVLTRHLRRYPQKVADYVHYSELKRIPRSEAPQRDFFFMAEKSEKKRSKADVTLFSVCWPFKLKYISDCC